jgi:hypothetical protein
MSSETENKIVNLGRRRLAKGGLVGTVILATFASKNALAAAPYQCTLSGLLSGNQSPKGPATSQSCDLGPSAVDLKTPGNWDSVVSTTLFSEVFSGGNSNVYYTQDNKLVKADVPGAQPASLFDVINMTVDTNNAPPNVDLGRAAIAAFVGWSKEGSNYPLTAQQIKDMFNATIVVSGEYHFSSSLGTVKLSASEVLDYFNYLTGGPKPVIIP